MGTMEGAAGNKKSYTNQYIHKWITEMCHPQLCLLKDNETLQSARCSIAGTVCESPFLILTAQYNERKPEVLDVSSYCAACQSVKFNQASQLFILDVKVKLK